MAYLSLGRRDDAEASFRKSIELSGDRYSEAEVGLGTLMLDRRDFAQGEKAVRRGVELNPDYWLGQYELGRALLNLDRVAEALKPRTRRNRSRPAPPSCTGCYPIFICGRRIIPRCWQTLIPTSSLIRTAPREFARSNCASK